MQSLKKPLSSKRKVLTRICLGIGASLFFLSSFFLNNFLKGTNLSILTDTKQIQRSDGANVTSNPQIEEEEIVTHLMNLSGDGKVPSFSAKQGEIDSFLAQNLSLLGSEEGLDSEQKIQFGNFSEAKSAKMVKPSVGNVSIGISEKSRLTDVSDDDNHHSKRASDDADNGSFYNCDVYDGRWVMVDDDILPYYPASSCPYVEKEFDCHINGRPDDAFAKWRWQPNGCDIPRLNATDFLERLRGKKLIFVGDSMNRNMWESLVCVLQQSVKDKKRVFEIAGRTDFKKKAYYSFRFKDYDCSVDFVVSRFLVKESSFKRKNGSFETLRLDLMDDVTSKLLTADILVFNTGHWWTHEKTRIGKDYYQEGNYVHHKLKVLEAYTKALTTWGKWIDKNVNSSQTHVIFRGFSLTHFRGGRWNSGGQCHEETEPIQNAKQLAAYPSKMRALERVLRKMKTPVIYMNISRLTDFRKDGHPSIYKKTYGTDEERIEAVRNHQDCSHWCLPGVPDTWNALMYVSLLNADFGSNKN